MWKNGSGVTAMVSEPRTVGVPSATCTRLAMRFVCESMTPLGTPVVPEENGITATSVDGSMSCSGAGWPSASISAMPWTPVRPTTWSSVKPAFSAPCVPAQPMADVVRIIFAPDAVSCLATSSAVASVATVVTVALARRMPW